MKILWILLAINIFIAPTLSQEGTDQIPLTGAFDITIPTTWEIDSQSPTGYFWNTPDSVIRIRTYPPLFNIDVFELYDPTLEEYVEYMVTDVFEARTFDTDELAEIQFGDYSGLGYKFESIEEGVQFEFQLYAYILEDGNIVLGYIKPLNGYDLKLDDSDALVNALGTIEKRTEYIFYDGATFAISDDTWSIADETVLGLAKVSLEQETIIVNVRYWPRYAAIAGFENPRDFLAYIWDSNFEDYGRFNREIIEEEQIAGFDSIFHPLDHPLLNNRDMYERGVIVFELTSNNSYITAEIMTQESDTDYTAVYTLLDTFRPGNRLVCPLFATPGITIREEPSTRSEAVRQTSQETLIAQFESTGTDGYMWFNVSEGWVRSDVIFYELNTCEGLPTRP